MKRYFIFVSLPALFLCVGLLPNHSIAVQIGAGAFGPSAVVESFEGLSAGPNIPFSSNYPDYLLPGSASAYTFTSGVTMTSPIPNPDVADGNVLIGDFALKSGATWDLGTNGVVTSAANVPFGSAYLGIDDSTGTQVVEFTFSTTMLRVGAYVTAYENNSITLSAYDASDNLLESYSIPPVNVTNWSTNFLGIENNAGIKKVRFSGVFAVMDGFTFEQRSGATHVPIMTEWGLIIFVLLVGLGSLYYLRKRSEI